MEAVDPRHYTDSELYRDQTIRYGYDVVNDRYVARVRITDDYGGHEIYLFTSDDLDQILEKARALVDATSVFDAR